METSQILDKIKPAVMGWISAFLGKEGSYTPTLVNTTNVSSSSAAVCYYVQFGNSVVVWGSVNATATAAGGCVLSISIPIASTFTAQQQLAGASNSAASSWPAYIRGSTTAYNAVMVWAASSTTAQTFFFNFWYKVV